MSFAPKPGCPMCGIVSQAQRQRDGLVVLPSPSASPSPSPSPPRPNSQPEVLWHDTNLTAYRERTNPVSSKGHIIIAFKCVLLPCFRASCSEGVGISLHVPSIYTLVCQSSKPSSIGRFIDAHVFFYPSLRAISPSSRLFAK